VSATRTISQLLLRLPAALWRRLLHQWALLRARRLTLDRAATQCPKRLLVLCYGNIYRSPFVATYLKRRLAGEGDIEIRSAGFHPKTGRPSPPDYVALVRKRQIDLGTHQSSLVSTADLEWAEAIVIMDRYNWERLRRFGAEIEAKILWLGAFAGNGPVELQDPYNLPAPQVEVIVTQLQAATDGLVRRLLQGRD